MRLIVFFLCAYGCLALGYTHTSSLSITPQNLDHRVTGLSRDGWTGPVLQLKDDSFLWWTAKAQLTLDAWRPGENARIRSLGIIDKRATFKLPLTPDGLTLSVDNPFKARAPDSRMLGVKLLSVRLIPRFGLILPSFPIVLRFLPLVALLLGSGFFLLMGISAYQYKRGLFGLAAIVTSLLLAASEPSSWPRLWPLALLLASLAIGANFYRRSENTLSSTPLSRAHSYLALIILLGGLLRFMAIDFGLPAFFHPDEPRKAAIAQRIVEKGDWDPAYFKHPSFMIYSSAAVGELAEAWTGTLPSHSEFVLFGRLTSATLGTLSIFLVFLIGRLLHHQTTGLVAAGFLAVVPLHVVCSRYLKEDASLLFFVLLTTYFSVRALREKNIPYFILSCLSAGFATSTKYSGLLVLPLPFLFPLQAFVEGNRLKNLRLIIVGGLLCALGFVLVSPYSLLNHEAFLRDFLWEKQHMEKGHSRSISAASYYWMYHLGQSILPGMSTPLALFALVGVGWLLVRRQWQDLLLLALVLLFYLPAEWVKAKPAPQPERYILPTLPFLCLAGGVFWQHLSTKAPRTANVLLIVLLAFPLQFSFSHGLAAREDTRQLAANWVESHIPPGSEIILDWYTYSAPIPRDKYRIREIVSDKELFTNPSPANISATGADYLLLSSLYYQRYLEQDKVRRNSIAAKMRNLLQAYKPEKSFSQKRYAYGFHNPSIMVYKLRNEG